MSTAQLITTNGIPQFAVLPYQQYLELLAKAEGYDNVEDYLDYHRAVQTMESTTEWVSLEKAEQKLRDRNNVA